MSIEQLKNKLPDYAKDIKLNLSNIFSTESSADLNQKQIFIIALGVSYALKNYLITDSILLEAKQLISEKDIQAAKAAATIMAMNNVYYRSIHLLSDKSFSSMPAKLRMNVIGNPGVDQIDFELACLAISAINGCGKCLDSHTNELIKNGVTKTGIQFAIRVAAVLNAASTGIKIGEEIFAS